MDYHYLEKIWGEKRNMKMLVCLCAEWLTLIKDIASGVADGEFISTVLALLFLIAAVIALIVVCVLAYKRKKSGGNTNNREYRNTNTAEESLAQQVTCLANELANTRKCKEELEQKNRELSEELRNRKNLMDFVEYMFMNDFTILPKMCLDVARNRAYNQIDIRKLRVTYAYDFSEWDNEDLSEKNEFGYDSRITFWAEVDNHDLPVTYKRYAGNMYADKLVPLFQKHGNSSQFTEVEAKMDRDNTEIKANIAQYSWRLLPKNIGHGPTLNMEYYWQYRENWNYKKSGEYEKHGKAQGRGILIHYPAHYGKSIDEFEIIVSFKGEKVKITDMTVYRIGREGKAQTYSASQIDKGTIIGNTASLTFNPNVDRFEAIYAKVKWALQG